MYLTSVRYQLWSLLTGKRVLLMSGKSERNLCNSLASERFKTIKIHTSLSYHSQTSVAEAEHSPQCLCMMYMSRSHIVHVELDSGLCYRLKLGFQKSKPSILVLGLSGFIYSCHQRQLVETFPLIPLFLTCIPGLKGFENVTGTVPQRMLFAKCIGEESDWPKWVEVLAPCLVLVSIICGVPRMLLLLR